MPSASRLRLALPVAGLWSGMWAAFALASVPWASAGLAIMGAVFALLQRGKRPLSAIAIAFAVLGLVLVWWRAWLVTPTAQWQGQHHVEFRITSDPALVKSQRSSLELDYQWQARADLLTLDGAAQRALPVILRLPAAGGWELSATGECAAEVTLFEGWGRARGFATCDDGAQQVASTTRLQKAALFLRSAMQRAVKDLAPADGAALLPGLVLGDTSRVDPLDARRMRIAGLGHLTAVSGANLAIMLGALELLLRRTRLPIKWRVGILAVMLCGLVVLVRPSASVVRAAAMAALGLWVAWQGERRRSDLLLLAGVAGLLVVDPWLATDWGFALSTGATAGLIFLSPLLWPERKSWLARAAAVAVAATVSTLPVLLLMGTQPMLVSVPANLLAEPLVAPATVFGLLAGAVEAVALLPPLHWLAQVLAQVGVFAAAAILQVSRWVTRAAFLVPVVSWQSAIALLCVVVVWRLRRGRSVAIAVGGCALLLTQLVAVRSSDWLGGDWQVVACDVGQGDATLAKTRTGDIVLVDTGPDAAALDDCLNAAGVSKIDLLVISHWHADHIGGLPAALEREVGEVLLPCGKSPIGGQRWASALIAGLPLRQAEAGLSLNSVEVLACPPDAGAEGSEVNNSSLVVAVDVASGRLLLAADAETALQEELMSSFAAHQFAIVKVPHHGSLSQSPSFAAWTGAKWAWVSVGKDNDYGHPAPETLAQYLAAGLQLADTESCGAIAWLATGWHTQRDCAAV